MHINCRGCELEVFLSPSWKMLRPFIGEISGEFNVNRSFSSKHVDGKLDAKDANINPNFFHFTSRKDLVEQIQTVDPHGNDVEKVDEFSRWLLEQLEIWRIESAENEAKT